jgi:uncharacterized protein with GYD domain
MATYITSVQFTPQGMAQIKDTCKRATSFKTAAKKLGAKVIEVYWTQGVWDGVLIFEAADDETASALMLNLASQGNVKTQTVRAFTAAEMEKIVGRMTK